MRRLASVLVASKRGDKSDAPTFSSSPDDSSRHHLAHKKSRVFPSLSRKHLSTNPSPPPLVASDLTNSSSSSSSGSTTLRTPDDDGLPRTSGRKGSWKSWLGGKDTAVGDHPEEHLPAWQSSQGVLSPLKPGSNETDDSSSQFDDPYGNPDETITQLHSVQQAATARTNARIMITNSLVRECTSPPLFQLSDAIVFPRSCHNSRRLRRRETLESELHKKSLLRRLDQLSPSAELSIVPLASKLISPRSQSLQNFQDDVYPAANAVKVNSIGLQNWVLRPCFEDRLQFWTCLDSGEVIQTRVPGSHFGVAALEFSESLELLAGTLLENDEVMEVSEAVQPPLILSPDSPATSVKELGRESPSLSSKESYAKQSSFTQSCIIPPALPKTLSPERQPDGSMTSGSATTIGAVPKRGVRFADDDGKDDQIPLGYVLRIRKNKEQKAQFLREERARREREAQLSMENHGVNVPLVESGVTKVVAPRQRPSHPLISLNEPTTIAPPKPQQMTVSHVVKEEERLRLEVARIEMEKLRRSRESSRKQAEEWERAYNEDIQVMRTRREASHPGLSPPVASHDRSAFRDSTHASFGRSNMVHKYTPELIFSPVTLHDGSPSSSMPATPGSQYSLSRPPSLYSTHTASSEDVRGRDGKRVSRRMSGVSDSGKGMSLHPPYDSRPSFNPYAWAGAPVVAAIPPVPPMPVTPMVNGIPVYGIDMPLLPPTPPFMMNQFGIRSHSYTGLGGQYSPHQTLAPPRNYSSEGVNMSSRNSSPHSSGSHQRRSSDEGTRMGKTLGDSRLGSNDVRANRKSAFMQVAPSQSSPKRASWLPPDQNTSRKPSLRPVPAVYPPSPSAPMRRRTAAS